MSPVDTLANVGLLIITMIMSYGFGYALGHVIYALSWLVKHSAIWLKKTGGTPFRYLRRKLNDCRLHQALEETRRLDEKRDEELRRSRLAREALSPANQRILPIRVITNPMIQ